MEQVVQNVNLNLFFHCQLSMSWIFGTEVTAGLIPTVDCDSAFFFGFFFLAFIIQSFAFILLVLTIFE